MCILSIVYLFVAKEMVKPESLLFENPLSNIIIVFVSWIVYVPLEGKRKVYMNCIGIIRLFVRNGAF